ncbi:MAG: hypothetical protein B7Y25_03685 [Alphaproteobacteria bacterium 16-39-46]|nr:MAG: hypothetical protein B7Y25_03685 [Alphaproteobacteria bacterium 16-39-46]OZA43154.1 MAG: hypothetical protein B7X84_03910 [Alphaproteobacteria bacterium 17-39-52]HQS84001.1 hypothetical protein [Alphaproteobacteria bacterium]HQS93881.1 hypothetical protein [Alphaproteobacteria bacterium]
MQPLYAAESGESAGPSIALTSAQKDKIREELDALGIETSKDGVPTISYIFALKKVKQISEALRYSYSPQLAGEEGMKVVLQVFRQMPPELRGVGIDFPREVYQFVINKVTSNPSWHSSSFKNTEELVRKATVEIGEIRQLSDQLFPKVGSHQMEYNFNLALRLKFAGFNVSTENFQVVSRVRKIFKEEDLLYNSARVIDLLASFNLLLKSSAGVISEKFVDDIKANLLELKRQGYTSEEINKQNLVMVTLYLQHEGRKISPGNIKQLIHRGNLEALVWQKMIKLFKDKKIDSLERQEILDSA